MNSDTAVIANITEQSYIAHRTYGTFRIAGRAPAGTITHSGMAMTSEMAAPSGGNAASPSQPGSPVGADYSTTRVTSRTAVMDYGDKRTLPLVITAREIAEDLCREINSDAGEQSFLGVFVCVGNTPTEEELNGARKRIDEFYRALVATADREWERSHSYLFINDLQRRAAAYLHLKKEWYYQEPVYAGECPGCGERVKGGVAVCKSCGAILDREKALALGLAQPLAPAAVAGVGVQAEKPRGK